MRLLLVAVALLAGAAFARAPVPASAVQASTIRVALHQLGAQAVDIQEVAGRIAATAARTREAGRPVALGPIESDLAALQQDLADLDKLLNQLDRSVAPH